MGLSNFKGRKAAPFKRGANRRKAGAKKAAATRKMRKGRRG